MVSSTEIPDAFLYNWHPRRRQTGGKTAGAEPKNSSPNSTKSSSTDAYTPTSKPPSNMKICSACDSCRQSRVKCSGGRTCQRCSNNNYICNYSVSLRSGRLKARRNRQSISQTSQSQSPVAQPAIADLVNKSPEPGNPPLTPPQTIASTDPLQTTDLEAEADLLDAMGFAMQQDDFSDDLFSFTNLSPIGGDLTFIEPTSPLSPEKPYTTEHNFNLSTGTNYNYRSPKRAASTVSSQSDRDRDFLRSSPRADSISPSSTLANPISFIKFGASSNCSCLANQLYCSAELCNIQNDAISLDTVLNFTRESGKHVANYLGCKECPKGSANFIFPAIILQFLVKLFCKTAKNGSAYMKSIKISVGTFELSDEEDLKHKKLLVISAARHVDLILGGLGDAVCEYQQKELVQQKTADLTTESGRSNLKWIFDNVRNLRLRLKTIIEILESVD